ncbi:MAG: GntR family transcriptional regulator [bacterium]|nr:GntR family transcriptional regulator [bacterium]
MSRNKNSPKYKEIIDYLMEMVRNGKKMDKLPTEIELSHRFRVSHVTVRRALEELEKNSLIMRLPGRGTFIKNPVHVSKILKFLIILPPRRTATTGFFIPPIVSGILSSEIEDEFDIQTFSFNYDSSEVLNICTGSGINGVIWITPDLGQLNYVKELESFSYPVIGINRIEPGINYVSTDHETSARQMADFLIKKGHKRIGFVGFCEDLSYIVHRYKGFISAFRDAGINFDEDGLVRMSVTKHIPFEFDVLKFKNDFVYMFEKYKPSAIFVLGSGLIEMVLDTIIERGINVPRDLEIATFDEVPERYEQKKYIHELVQPLFELGKYATESLKKLLNGEVKKVEIVLPCTQKLKTERG